MQAIILLGPPGAGKGTLAERIRGAAGLVHVSTGDMLREAIKAGRPVGLQAQAYMLKGELVPDRVIMDVVIDRMGGEAADARFLFDGFPRTLEQARLLEAELAARGGRVVRVFLLDAPEAVLVERLSGRRVCRECGAVYHVRNIPTRVPGRCDACGGEVYQRKDDGESTVRNRLEVFRRQTAELIEYYDRQGLLRRIDAGRDRTIVQAEMLADLQDPARGR
jgi:adenylate kinase